jgi:hypothetical protein
VEVQLVRTSNMITLLLEEVPVEKELGRAKAARTIHAVAPEQAREPMVRGKRLHHQGSISCVGGV